MWEKGELSTTSAEEEKKQNFFYFHLPSLDPNLLLRRRIERDSTKAALKRSGTQQSQPKVGPTMVQQNLCGQQIQQVGGFVIVRARGKRTAQDWPNICGRRRTVLFRVRV